MSDWWHTIAVETMEGILLIGAVMTAIGLGIKRIYSVARSVEKILEVAVEQKAKNEAIAEELVAHINMEDARDQIRDKQIAELVSTVREIGREMRPNGGSSMKDILNHTAENVASISTRTAVLEEWKRMHDREYKDLRSKTEYQP